MIYTDSSALVKLVRNEAESAPLREWLGGTTFPVVSSSLARVEVVRSVLKDGNLLSRARQVLAGVELMPMTHDLLDDAAVVSQQVRSLDAIHLVSAIRLREDLHAFVAYDKRLLDAAVEVGLPIASPDGS